MELKIGSVVRAMAGRDKGGFFVVTAVDKSCCSIVDGKSRKLARPKRKNVRHISLTGSMIDINDLTDKKLRTMLKSFGSAE